MRFATIVTVAILALVSALLLAPLNYYIPERHAVAQKAMSLGMPAVAAALLSPLVQMSDTRALNNLGVLRARGVGIRQDSVEAQRLFARAAEQGSGRARLNAIMAQRGGCGTRIDDAAITAEALGPLTRSDPMAANLIHDCLYFDATARLLPDRSDRTLAAENETQKPRDAEALLHAGWAMLNLARTTTIPDYGDEEETKRYEEKVLPIARKAMELLFAAGESGAPGAYEALGILSMQFGEKLGDDPLAVRLRDRDNWEWWRSAPTKVTGRRNAGSRTQPSRSCVMTVSPIPARHSARWSRRPAAASTVKSYSKTLCGSTRPSGLSLHRGCVRKPGPYWKSRLQQRR